MKKILFFLIIVCTVLCHANNDKGLDANEQQALYGSLEQAEKALKSAPFGKKAIAILPIPQDKDGLIAGRLKNILTRQGFICVEGKEDPMWDEIMKEIGWDELKSMRDSILDQATLVKFGKLKAAQILLYGKIRVLDRKPDRIYTELELHATDIATKQHIWGGNFGSRFYLDKEIQGIVNFDSECRLLLKKNFDEAKKSLLKPDFVQKRGHIKTVAVIPLAGDCDQYITGLAFEMLSHTELHPKYPRIPSLSQLRTFGRSGQADCDAVFYGAVRDCRKTPTINKEYPSLRKKLSSFTVSADIQLFLEDIRNGNVLWSKTITLAKKYNSVSYLNPDTKPSSSIIKPAPDIPNPEQQTGNIIFLNHHRDRLRLIFIFKGKTDEEKELAKKIIQRVSSAMNLDDVIVMAQDKSDVQLSVQPNQKQIDSDLLLSVQPNLKQIDSDLLLPVQPNQKQIDSDMAYYRMNCEVFSELRSGDSQRIFGSDVLKLVAPRRLRGKDAAISQFSEPAAAHIVKKFKSLLNMIADKELGATILKFQLPSASRGNARNLVEDSIKIKKIAQELSNMKNLVSCELISQDLKNGICQFRVVFFRKAYPAGISNEANALIQLLSVDN